jgi:hypothetical protein
MSSNVWCVVPEGKKIDLVFVDQTGTSRPFWIALKKRLNNAEQRVLTTAGWRGLRDPSPAESSGSDKDAQVRTPTLHVDWAERTAMRVEVYLLEWSLCDDEGHLLDCHSRAQLDALDPDVAALIDDAVQKHEQEITEEKKRRNTPIKSLQKSA